MSVSERRFGGARTRAAAVGREHAGAEKDKVRYPAMRTNNWDNNRRKLVINIAYHLLKKSPWFIMATIMYPKHKKARLMFLICLVLVVASVIFAISSSNPLLSLALVGGSLALTAGTLLYVLVKTTKSQGKLKINNDSSQTPYVELVETLAYLFFVR